MIKIDRERTAARRFEHEKSRVLKDGREILVGADWKYRKAELWFRSGGRCEAWREIIGIKPERCTAEAEDPHHLIRRSELRDDRLSNLQALCRFHHDLLNKRKPKWTRREREAVKCD